MPANLVTPWSIAALSALVLLLALILIPLLADSAARFFSRVRDLLLAFASGLGTLIKKVWGRDDVVAKKRAEIEAAYREEITRRSEVTYKLLDDAQIAKIRAIAEQKYGGVQTSNGSQMSNGGQPANGGQPSNNSGILGTARKVWGGKSKQQRLIDDEVRREIERQSKEPQKNLTTEELQQIHEMVIQQHGGVPEPSIGLLTSAWVRRVIFLLLAIVCVGSDYVLVSTRAPILFGGGETPDFLKTLFQYLQVITGVLFVSIAALSGMLIQEHSRGLPDVVKIEPDIANTEKKLKLGLAIAMFVIDVIVVIFLTLGGIFQQYLQQQDLEVIYIVFIGTSVLVAVGIFLAWTGLYQAVEGLGALILGGAVALVCVILAFICSVLVAFLSLLSGINAWLVSIFTGREPKVKPVLIDDRDLAIVGFGTEGSAFAVAICKQLSQLFGSFAWLAGVYAPTTAETNKLDRDLRRTKVAGHFISVAARVNPEQAAEAMANNLRKFYGNMKRDEVKPLLWVVNGDELALCLQALQAFDATDDIFQTSQNIKNVKMVILWMVPQTITDKMKATASALRDWAKRPNSILATTLVIESSCPLSRTLVNQQYPVLERSIASLLGAGVINARNSFDTVVASMYNAGFAFSSLDAGSIGVDTSPGNFRQGVIMGSKGQINPDNASGRTSIIAKAAFTDHALSTVDHETWLQTGQPGWERQQQTLFVNIIVPSVSKLPALHLREYKDFVTSWLSNEYSVNPEQVTFVQLVSERDKGTDISSQPQVAQLKGEYYFHFTALRGIGAGGWALPNDLNNPAASGNTPSSRSAQGSPATEGGMTSMPSISSMPSMPGSPTYDSKYSPTPTTPSNGSPFGVSDADTITQ